MSGIPNIKIKDWIENPEFRGRISFSLSRLQEENPEISETAIKSALSRLSKKGKVVPIHKGFYLIISSEYALRGIIPPDLLNEKKTKTGYIKVSSEISTALDLVQYQNHSGGLSRIATVLYELMEEIHPESFSKEIFAYSTTSAIQRLGYLFEYKLDNKALADALYEQALKYGSRFQKIPFRQSVPYKGIPADNRWRIAVNVEIERDDIWYLKKEETKQKYLLKHPFKPINQEDKRNHKYVSRILNKEKSFRLSIDDSVNQFNHVSKKYGYFETRALFSKLPFNHCGKFFLDFVNEFQVKEKPSLNAVEERIDRYNALNYNKLPKRRIKAYRST